jgi:hypothetical protein
MTRLTARSRPQAPRRIGVLRERASGGHSLLELLVIMGVLSILTGTAFLGYRSNRLQINNAQRIVVGSLRGARASAISKSVHFTVEFAASDRLLVQRMVYDDSGWHVDATSVRTVPLPAPAYFYSSTVGSKVEFDSRGIAVNLTAPRSIELRDSFGVSKSIQAWPSGEIQ